MPSSSKSWKFLRLVLLFLATRTSASDVWTGPAFSADPTELRQATTNVVVGKHDPATMFLNELRFNFDAAGTLMESRHYVYRIENKEGVENWAETSGRWEAWHQTKPEIRARVITAEGTVHWLDPRTLTDVPVRQDARDIYNDVHRYGGPLPAVAPGAIVEEEVVIRETVPFFKAGTVERRNFAWSVPVSKTRIIITHPTSVPLQYRVHLLPDAAITKSSQDGVETITVEQGLLPASAGNVQYAPPDLVLYPEIEFTTGTSWQLVASEYAHLTDAKVRLDDVQPLLTKINSKDGSRNAVVRQIVATLHRNVRYTGVEFGESSLIPQFPSETLNRKYGDCKDKATLLVAMLRGAGVPANLALLNTGPGRDVNAELPGMGLFDHAIVYIPASGSNAELWIDATAQYSQVGTLPWMDYGRWALVVSESSKSLKHIPDLTSAENAHRELREFTLAEYGKAKIIETDEEIGPGEADYRSYYSGDSKQIKESSENYVKDMYLADSLTSLEHGDLGDMEKPASIRFVTQGKRGTTDLESAVVAIRVESLFDRLPGYFRTKEDKQADDDDEDEPDKNTPRTADWWITPFVTEWRYKVTAPVGFQLRALPSDRNEKIGTISFTQKYSADSENTAVDAVFRVESTSTRLTVQQAKDLRDAVVRARSADPIFIAFDQVGHSLLAAGKIREGLDAYHQLSLQHPKEALHKVQLAQALLNVGLAEPARSAAQRAAALEPTSALAFSTLGMVLKHDLIGRPLEKGMDFEGAIAAYKKAIALDPKDKETRANLALLMEYDADGNRYGERARLKDAVAELRELKKVDEDYSRNYDDNVLYDLWYAHDYKGVLEYAATIQTSEVRKGLVLGATAIQQGVEAGLKKSLEITTNHEERAKVLVNGGTVLIRVRKYAEGAAMLAEGARGLSNESQVARGAGIFSKAKPYEEVKIDASDPRSVVQQLMAKMLSGTLTFAEFKSLIYGDLADTEEATDQERFQQMMSTLKAQIGSAGLPLITITDIAISNMRYTVDGDDQTGYKIILESPGAPAQDLYVVRDGDRYKVAAFSASGETDSEGLGLLALQSLERNNADAAKKWLDRARDRIHIGGGDDPLAGQVFPHFWTKGQDADSNTIRKAAWSCFRRSRQKDRTLLHWSRLVSPPRAIWNVPVSPWCWRMRMSPRNAGRTSFRWARS